MMVVANLWGWIVSRKLIELIAYGSALCFALASIYAFSLRYELHTERLEHTNAIQTIRVELNQVTLERDEYKRSFEQLKNDLTAANRANAEAYAEAQKDNADAMAKLRNQQLQADKSQTSQLKVIQNQDAVCKAALESLDTYCKGVGEL